MTQQLIPAESSIVRSDNNHDSLLVAQLNFLCDIPDIADNPAPTDIEKQMASLRRQPDAKAIQPHPYFGFKYLGVEYIRNALDLVFGNGNWTVVSLPGYPSFRLSERLTAKQKQYYICTDRVYLIVRWATGKLQKIRGIGEAMFLFEDNNTERATAEQVAHSDALKDAAKWLGPRMGSTLRSDIKGGLLVEAEIEHDKEIINDAVGVRLWWSAQQGQDVFITPEILDILAEHYCGATVAKLDSKGLRNFANIIMEAPTEQEKKALITEARKVGIEASEKSRYSVLRKVVDQKKTELADSILS